MKLIQPLTAALAFVPSSNLVLADSSSGDTAIGNTFSPTPAPTPLLRGTQISTMSSAGDSSYIEGKPEDNTSSGVVASLEDEINQLKEILDTLGDNQEEILRVNKSTRFFVGLNYIIGLSTIGILGCIRNGR